MTTWVDAGRYGRLCREITNETGSRAICHVWTRQNSRHKTKDGTEPWPEGEANFRLILAAPELLEALCSIRDKVECYLQPLDCPSVNRARLEAVRKQAVTAIAAVKGENSDDIG